MTYRDRVEQTTSVVGTGPVALGAAASGARAFVSSATHAIGETVDYCIDGGDEWEVGSGTLTDASTLVRTSITASSNNGALVNFSASAKRVYETVSAASLDQMAAARDVSFATVVPLNRVGAAYMSQGSVTGVLTFTPAAGAVRGALAYLRLVANGTHAPNLAAFKEWGGSMGYDNRSGIVNVFQFFYDGADYWYTVAQQVGAVASDTTAPTASAASVANATPTYVDVTLSEPMDTAYTPAASTVTVSGHTVSALAYTSATNLRATVNAFVNGEAARTVAYTANGTNNARDLAGNPLANFSGLAVANNVGAVASGVSLAGPSGGTVSTASSNFAVGVTPVGGSISGTVVVTPTDNGGGGTFTPTTVSLTSAAPAAAFTYTPSATAGARTISVTNNGGLTNPANIVYTSTAAGTYLRLTSLTNATEGGSGPYTYTGTGSQYVTLTPGPGGVAEKKFADGVDGSAAFAFSGMTTDSVPMLGLRNVAGMQAWGNLDYALYTVGGASPVYKIKTGSSSSTFVNGNLSATTTPANGDTMRLRRAGTTLTAEISRAATPDTWIGVHSWTAVPTGEFYVNMYTGTACVLSALAASGLA